MDKKYKNILFDLDGTISDSSIGIIKAFKYSFEMMQHPCPEDKELISFIGPPLNETYYKYFPKEKAQQARAFYREYYLSIGMYENELYPEIVNVLKNLYEKYTLFVATCKGTPNARDVIKNFNINQYFKGVYGVESELNILDKTDVIKNIMTIYNLNSAETLFIGDTLHDTIGAFQNNVDMCFVNYGFGKKEDIKDFEVAFFIDNPQQILDILT